ncbi:hypothetical protein [Lunatibacter salilacus]|uniref:hypothetical protein n=1 Tax=Lunatibacter salilacus TaxID=2483804 RepID=UPI001F28B583|nr:hypothetical protein [Lunatibacter salilacus]
MAQDDYIKTLMSSFRPEENLTKRGKERNLPSTKTAKTMNENGNILPVLDQVRDLNIEGDKKRLIKIDRRNEEILKVMYPVFAVDVTRFVNFLLTNFFQEHPELIEEIRKSFKKL